MLTWVVCCSAEEFQPVLPENSQLAARQRLSLVLMHRRYVKANTIMDMHSLLSESVLQRPMYLFERVPDLAAVPVCLLPLAH